MSTDRVIFTDRAPKPIGPYSQAVVAGGLVFVSGQIGIDPRTGGLVGSGVREQARQALENVKEVLKAAGCSMDDVVLVLAFLRDLKKYSEFNEVYSEYFKVFPARAVVGVSELPAGAQVEILAVAVRPPARSKEE